jgi:hypothetical protein
MTKRAMLPAPAAGQIWRDARDVHVRTLRVDQVSVDKWGKPMVTCTVIRQEDGDKVTEPMRETTMTVSRLASRAFQHIRDFQELVNPTAPKRIQRRRIKGWTMPEGAVYVGRPTRFGNPYTLGGANGLACTPGALTGSDWEFEDRISSAGMHHDFFHGDGRVTPCEIRNLTRAEAVELYREALTRDTVHLRDPRWHRIGPRDNPLTVNEIRDQLAGKDLACWCPLDQPCHADVLLEIANGATE